MKEHLKWEVNGRFIQLPERNYKAIAEFKPPIHDIPVNDEEYTEIKNLVNAAPKLLDALEGLIDFCDGLDSQHGIDDYFLGGDDFYQNYKTIFEKAIKARNKAKGDNND